MNLWLDDVREPWKFGCVGWTWAKTAAEAITLLETGQVCAASLDHDLAEEHYPWNCKELPGKGAGTGYDVVCWLEEHPQFWPPNGVSVHSMNPSGGARMLAVIGRHYATPASL